MNAALRQNIIIQPGGLIEIRSPELPAGATAEVIIILDDLAVSSTPPMQNMAHPRTAEDLGWPPGFFDQTFGSLPDFPDIEPEGEYEIRDEFP